MNRLAELAKLQSSQIWKTWSERQLRRRSSAIEELAASGVYDRYDAETGLNQVQTAAGLVSARSITNAGLQQGDRVALNPGAGTLKTTPR